MMPRTVKPNHFFQVGPDGTILVDAEVPEDTTSPVLCSFCGRIYDLGKVEVTGRYADATVFVTPCCNRQADDRGWKGHPDYRELVRRDGRLVLR